jgi:hypothetical protein
MLAVITPANASPADHLGITWLSVGTTSIPIVVGLIRAMDPSPAMRSDSTSPVPRRQIDDTVGAPRSPPDTVSGPACQLCVDVASQG